MAHTYASNFIHCIFSTKERRAALPIERTADLYAYLGGIARSESFTLVAAGGTANHVHLLIALQATGCLATAVQKLKGSSSRWLGKGFAWQEVHFEGHPPGRDVVNFVLHQVDAIRDSHNHQSANEPTLP